MLKSNWDSDIHADRGRTPRQAEPIPWWQARLEWQRLASDSLLAFASVTLVTAVIVAMHLYPRVPSIVLTYLLVIIVLASIRGYYVAFLAALLASVSFAFFIPTSDTFAFAILEDLPFSDPVVFLATAIITGVLTATLRHHTEQARRGEQIAHLLSQQAQELAAFQERQHLARELHDSVFQALYGINLGVRSAKEALDSDPTEAIAPLEYVIALIEASLVEMRALIFDLRPESLANEGIIAALTKQVAVLRTRYKLVVDAQMEEEPLLSLKDKQILYRVAQESLHNIIKHAHASFVTLRLAEQDGELILDIRDNGRGFDPSGSFPGHLGLRSIHERVALLDGTYSIESALSQGTHLHVRIPLHDGPRSTREGESSEKKISFPLLGGLLAIEKGNKKHVQ